MRASRTSEFCWIYSVLKEWQGDMDFLFENAMWINLLCWCGKVLRMSSCRGGLCGRRSEIVLHRTQSFPDSSPPITSQRWSHHWAWYCLCKNLFMKEWKLLKEEERTGRQWRNRNWWREPERNSKRILRSERQELFHGRAQFPKAQSLRKAHAKAEEKSKEGAPKGALTWKQCHPSTTGSLASFKIESGTVNTLGGERSPMWSLENGVVYFLKCFNGYFLFCFCFSIPERVIKYLY